MNRHVPLLFAASVGTLALATALFLPVSRSSVPSENTTGPDGTRLRISAKAPDSALGPPSPSLQGTSAAPVADPAAFAIDFQGKLAKATPTEREKLLQSLWTSRIRNPGLSTVLIDLFDQRRPELGATTKKVLLLIALQGGAESHSFFTRYLAPGALDADDGMIEGSMGECLRLVASRGELSNGEILTEAVFKAVAVNPGADLGDLVGGLLAANNPAFTSRLEDLCTKPAPGGPDSIRRGDIAAELILRTDDYADRFAQRLNEFTVAAQSSIFLGLSGISGPSTDDLQKLRSKSPQVLDPLFDRGLASSSAEVRLAACRSLCSRSLAATAPIQEKLRQVAASDRDARVRAKAEEALHVAGVK